VTTFYTYPQPTPEALGPRELEPRPRLDSKLGIAGEVGLANVSRRRRRGRSPPLDLTIRRLTVKSDGTEGCGAMNRMLDTGVGAGRRDWRLAGNRRRRAPLACRGSPLPIRKSIMSACRGQAKMVVQGQSLSKLLFRFGLLKKSQLGKARLRPAAIPGVNRLVIEPWLATLLTRASACDALERSWKPRTPSHDPSPRSIHNCMVS
jgi:hypothetical protein